MKRARGPDLRPFCQVSVENVSMKGNIIKKNLLQNGSKGCKNNTSSLFKCYNKNNTQNIKVFIKIIYIF